MDVQTLSFREKFCYGVTDLSFSIAYTVQSFFLLIFITDILTIPPALAGTLLLLTKAWDALIDPIIGYLSDHTKSKWGRRRPFMLWFSLPFGLAFILLWSLPTVASPFLQASLVLGALLVFITFFSLLSVPYTSLAPEMTLDYDERTRLNGYRMFFSIIGGLLAAVLPSGLLGMAPTLQAGYRLMGVCFGIWIGLLPLAAFFGTKERSMPAAESPTFLQGLRLVLQNRPFVLSLIMYLATWVAIDVISAVFLYYLKYWIGITEENSNIIFGLIFISAALFLPFWVKFTARFGKKGAYFTGLGSLSLLMLSLFFLPAGISPLIYVIAVLAGIGVSAAHIIPISMIPDAIEYDQLRTGKRQDGIYFGIVTFLQQLASSGALFLTGVVLQFCGYVPNTSQTPTALLGIRLLLGIFPGLIIIIGMLALVNYPINRESHTRALEELAARNS